MPYAYSYSTSPGPNAVHAHSCNIKAIEQTMLKQALAMMGPLSIYGGLHAHTVLNNPSLTLHPPVNH